MRNRIKEYPKDVLDKLEELRRNTRNRITISIIKNRYCVYEYKYLFDPGMKKSRMVSFYIGSISDAGEFIPAIHRKDTTKVENLDKHIRAGEKAGAEGHAYTMQNPDKIDLGILTKISMDSRASINEISSAVGVGKSTVTYRLKMLEKNYGIRRTIEVYPERFGFTRYIITVKFLAGKPDVAAVKKLLEAEPRVQLSLVMYGDYDLLIYIIAESTLKLEDTVYFFRSSRVFAGFPAIWNVGYTLEGYGYIPLRMEFFSLLKDRVWQKARESMRKRPDQLFRSEYAVLMDLNNDAGAPFSDIDKRNGLSSGSAQYTYYKLLERKLIERATITMQNPQVKYCALLYAVQKDIVAFNETRAAYLIDIIEETGRPANKYIFCGDSSAPYGAVFLAPVYEGSVDDIKREMEKKVNGIGIKTSVVAECIVGYLGFRKFDNTLSPQTKILRVMSEEKSKS